jgi:hypothetical protein
VDYGEKGTSGGLRSGTQEMANHLSKAYEVDIKNRTKGLEHSNKTGHKVNVYEINPGIVYRDENVTAKAFDAHHGQLPQTFGFASLAVCQDVALRWHHLR